MIQSQKSAQANADLLQTLLVGMENLGENFKQLQADLEYWKTPAHQEAEREYEQMNQDLLREVSLSVPAITEPENAAGPPNSSIPSVFTASQASVPQIVDITTTTEGLRSMGLRAEWVTGTALKKPYPGAPIPLVTTGFNLGQKGQEFQARIPQFFNFAGSNAGNNASPVSVGLKVL